MGCGTISDQQPDTKLERVADVIIRHCVRFLVIGVQAGYILGSSESPSMSIHSAGDRTANLKNLATAVKELGVTLRGPPQGLSFGPDDQTLKLGTNFTLATAVVDLELFGWDEPIGSFEDVAKQAVPYVVGKHTLQVIGLDDLIRIE